MMKRRQFLKTSALGTLAGGTMISQPGYTASHHNEEILVHIFLRGGIDGFNVIVPLGDKDHEYYSIMRPVLAIADSGTGSTLPIGSEPFGFNPKAAPLKDLYDAGHLAIVQATGTPNPIASRSHFDAEKYIELGTPGSVGTSTGWLHRHFFSMSSTLGLYPDEIFLPIVSLRNNPPVSLLGNSSVLTVWSPGDFKLDNAFWRWNIQEADWPDKGFMQLDLLPEIYALSDDEVTHAGNQALAAEAILRTSFKNDYTGNGSIAYQDNQIGNQLRDVAQMIKLDLGTRLFTLDYYSWDTHAAQDVAENYDDLLDYLSRAVAAFFDDLNSSAGTFTDRTTVIIQSEFGRRLFENNSRGTDHGSGNFMLVLGKQVNGGKVYGSWPGLYPGTANDWVDYANPKNGSIEPELFEGALSVTTDFRRVLSEYLQVRAQHTTLTLDYVFPGYSGYTPMGIFKSLDEKPDMIFRGDFES